MKAIKSFTVKYQERALLSFSTFPFTLSLPLIIPPSLSSSLSQFLSLYLVRGPVLVYQSELSNDLHACQEFKRIWFRFPIQVKIFFSKFERIFSGFEKNVRESRWLKIHNSDSDTIFLTWTLLISFQMNVYLNIIINVFIFMKCEKWA